MFSIKRLNKLLWMQHEVCDYNSNKKYTKWNKQKKEAQKMKEPKTETTYRYFNMN